VPGFRTERQHFRALPGSFFLSGWNVRDGVVSATVATDPRAQRTALRFIISIGILSFFADFTYEGSRSIIGPYLATLQATGTIVGVVTGFGELLGYALRLFSGRWADATGRYWPITIFGYVVQMASVPALALTGSWPAAAVLIILERVGKAIRNPPVQIRLGGFQIGIVQVPVERIEELVKALGDEAVRIRRAGIAEARQNVSFAGFAMPPHQLHLLYLLPWRRELLEVLELMMHVQERLPVRATR